MIWEVNSKNESAFWVRLFLSVCTDNSAAVRVKASDNRDITAAEGRI